MDKEQAYNFVEENKEQIDKDIMETFADMLKRGILSNIERLEIMEILGIELSDYANFYTNEYDGTEDIFTNY